MTIKISPATTPVDPERFASLLTQTLVNTPEDDAPRSTHPGDGWIRWVETTTKLTEAEVD